MTFLAVVSSPLPSSYVLYPVFFLNIQPQKNKFHSGVTLNGVTRGGPPPLATPLVDVFLRFDQIFSLVNEDYNRGFDVRRLASHAERSRYCLVWLCVSVRARKLKKPLDQKLL